MRGLKLILLISFLFVHLIAISQKIESLNISSIDSVGTKKNFKKIARFNKRKTRTQKNSIPYDPLGPSKATFYSAILPGLGQIYTRKYWKIPIVYTALGTGIGIAIWNKNKYDDMRAIFKNKLRGINTDTENKSSIPSDNFLIENQKKFQRQKEISIVATVGLYIFNIIDANITAHLQQYNLNDKLSFSPKLDVDFFTNTPNLGMVLEYNF